MSKALNELIENKKEFQNISVTPALGTRPDFDGFKECVQNIKDNTYAYRIGIFSFKDIDYNNFPIYSLGGGDPMEITPFYGVKQKINKLMKQTSLSHYNYTAGNKQQRTEVLKYLNEIGVKTYVDNDGNDVDLTINNLIFTSSTSHGFSLLLKAILRPHDVVLFSGPTYGLFSYYPERVGGETNVVNLEVEDGYIINPNRLAEKIDEINKRLENEYKGKLSYIPKVVAYLNENPHNPMGYVLSEKDKDLLVKIACVCEERGVFIIDDLIYRDLSFDRENLALPIASMKKYFNSTISLMGISKSFGLAGIRAGIIVANDVIIAKIRDIIFQNMDSLSLIQSTALTYCFSQHNTKKYRKYFKKVIKHYLVNLEIIKYFIYGTSNDNTKNKYKIEAKKCIKKLLKNDWSNFINNKSGIKFAGNVVPESGFFAVMDFTSLKGKKYKDITINNEDDLLYFLFKNAHIKFITGQSMAWPNKDELVARITFSMNKEKLVKRLNLINQAIAKLTD